jgi:hypothetical protein
VSELLPVPKFTTLDAAFGARGEHYCSRKEGSELERKFRKEAQVADKLFFNGGKLEDYGFAIKEGINKAAVYTALSALLKSFEPSHEAKIGTVARYLNSWCVPVDGAKS